MRNENIAKIALNAAKSSKCEARYIKQTLLRTMPASLWGTVNRLRDFAHAQSALCPVTQSRRLSFNNNWIYLDRRAIEVAKWIDKSGSRISRDLGKIFPVHTGHVRWRMRSGWNRILNGGVWQTSQLKSRTDRRRMFRLGGRIDHVTRTYDHCSRSNQMVKVQGHVTY